MNNELIWTLIAMMESRLHFLKLSIEKLEKFRNEKNDDFHDVLSSRLHETMYPLDKQLQVAIDHARFSIYRIFSSSNQSVELKKSGASLSDLAINCNEALSSIHLFRRNSHNLNDGGQIQFTKDGRRFHFQNKVEYLISWVLPNLFFHSVTVYNIMRQCNFQIGKSDFLCAQIAINDSNLFESFPTGGFIENA